jgi:hypothetical protein
LSAAITKKNSGRSFVTAIINSECEAEVANLLFSHGNNIIFRALSFTALSNYLTEHGDDEELTIIYSSDLVKKEQLTQSFKKFAKVRFISVSNERFDPAQLISSISESSRNPMIRQKMRISNLISIIGAPGSPGVTTISNQIAARFNGAHLIAIKSDQYRPLISDVNKLFEIENLEFLDKLDPAQRYFMDAGSTKALTTTLTDRRLGGQVLDAALNYSEQIIYLIRADTAGISSLAKFVADWQNLISPPKITYLLNQQRFDSAARLINGQFLSLLSSMVHLQLPFDHRASQSYPTSTRIKMLTHSTFSKQIDLLCKSLV